MSTLPDDDDAWRFAEAIIRDYGRYAYEIVQTRVRLLEGEGRPGVAKLWRDVAEAIKWLEAMQGEASKGDGPRGSLIRPRIEDGKI